MFGTKKDPQQEETIQRQADEIREFERRIIDINHRHKLELEQKDFDIKHFKDEEVQTLRDDLAQKNQRIAVLEKENAMLDC